MDIEEYREKHWAWKILLFDVSVFVGGALIAIVIFALLFFILNYFNIISLSTIYKPLALLPRQTTKSTLLGSPKLGEGGKNFSSLPTPTPTGFQYDVKKAQTLLTQYINDTLKPEFLPDKIEIKQGLTIDGRMEDIKYEFGSMFTANQGSFSANFHYQENSNIQNDFSIFIQPANVIQATATASLANSLLTSYFINPYSISNCQTKGTTSYCENFQAINNGKKGYGIAILNNIAKSMIFAFNCFIPKESKDYTTTNSCITP